MADVTEKNKVIALFQFISELNKLKQKAILNYGKHIAFWELSSLPNDSDNIHIYYRDRVEEEIIDAENDSGDILLSVHKPEFQKYPEPDLIFKDWLVYGWDNFHESAAVKEFIFSKESATVYNEPIKIYFNVSNERAAKYANWLKRRNDWAEKQKIIESTRKLFEKLYGIYFELQRETETEEIIVANGIICDRDNPEIKHPVLTHRVKLDYDADKNTVFILDTKVQSELYSTVIQALGKVNMDNINDLKEDLQANDYHPLDRNDTPIFLKELVHNLSAESIFSDAGVPADWKNNNRLILYMEPVYIVRKRPDGTLKAIEQIIENVQKTGEIPAHISDIVSGGKVEIPEDIDKESIEEQLAAIGGESVDILLSKEANREQLEIARRIEKYNAVLVQGPPGTGKTHTIANIMGHLLAQGKSVLVTSHTTKALSVLKEKVVPNLQNLCVSMIDDSNVDMERSVDGISDYMSNTNSKTLKDEMARLSEERQEIIKQLADVRRKIFAIIHQEYNCIVYNGEDISPSQAAKFVSDNAEKLSYIPGKVRLRTPIPLTFAQLTDLYRSNELLSGEDEIELAKDLPSPEQIMQPADFSSNLESLQKVNRQIENIAAQNNWTIDTDEKEHLIIINGSFGNFLAKLPSIEAVQELNSYVSSFEKIYNWMKVAAVDGKKGGNFSNRWLTLIKQIQKTNDYAGKIMAEQFEAKVQFADTSDIGIHKATFEEMRGIFSNNEEFIWFRKFFNMKYDFALSGENETVNNLPSPEQIMQPSDFSFTLNELKKLQGQIENIATQNNLKVTRNENLINIAGNFGNFSAELPKVESIQDLMEYISSFKKIDNWMKVAAVAAVDGRQGGEYKNRWLTLINQIQKTNDYAEKIMAEQFEAKVQFCGTSDIGIHKATFEEMRGIFSNNEEFIWFRKILNMKYGLALSIEDELENKLPSLEQIMQPSDFSFALDELKKLQGQIENIATQNNLKVTHNENLINITGKFGNFSAELPTAEAVQELNSYVSSFEKIYNWMKIAAVDGKQDGEYRNRWLKLINQIQKTNNFAEKIMAEQFEAKVQFLGTSDIGLHKTTFEEMRGIFSDGGKISWFIKKLFNKKYSLALDAFTINGKQVKSARDCDIILNYIELAEMRNQCAIYWDNLLSANGVPKFYDLNTTNQESIAVEWIPHIQKYLNWYKDSYQLLVDKLTVANVPSDVIFEVNSLDTDKDATDKIFSAIKTVIPAICGIFMAAIEKENYSATINQTKDILCYGKCVNSQVYKAVWSAINNCDNNEYSEAYSELKHIYDKYYNLADKYAPALKSVTINNKPAQSARDCDIILNYIELAEMRNQCAMYWDNLLSVDVKKFYELDAANPENVAKNYITLIEKYLNWYQDSYQPLVEKLTAVNVPPNIIFEENSFDTDKNSTDKKFSAIKTVIPAICNIFMAAIEKENYSATINKTKDIFSYGKCANSQICKAFLSAINNGDNKEYSKLYSEIKRMQEKYYNFADKYNVALKSVTTNGKQAKSARDCDIILHCIELDEMRNQCAIYWDNLLSVDVKKFYELDAANPENVAKNYITLIQKYLNWYKDSYQLLVDKLTVANVPSDVIFEANSLDSDIAATDKILSAIKTIIPAICDIFMAAIEKENYSAAVNKTKLILSHGKRGGSRVCKDILSAINKGNTDKYAETFSELKRMYEKYKLQNTRAEMLKTLEPVAPQWAEAIRNRIGIHGQFTVPSDIEDAWKWKQLSGIVAEIIEKPFATLQADSLRLSKKYRTITANYAEKCSWYHLLKRTEADIDMQQALQGWKQTVKRIGKGTGKRAPAQKAEARKSMVKCQKAVPAWIMPINRALETLNPKENRFDVVIIDEASQSDISSLAILYMGKKLIIVGDDKQVSPMAVGVDVDKMVALQNTYLKDKIPNAHLYDGKISIYDIAATTFQSLMLREHFRCVPEIIGFSNILSYNNKIKPLREASSSALLPAVINYRVADGQREGNTKTNPKEAKAIIAIMKACMEQPEYAQKSFGVISLLGDEGDQVKLISKLIETEIDPKEILQRRILCGNSANFQGDERDVIFLSMVDSGGGDAPIRIMNYGTDDAYRKRYNVAVSRARDQLWLVNSLDSANDLKPGDIRKKLIDYVTNPHSSEIEPAKVEENAESEFEISVAETLVNRGYHIVKNWKVGAYQLKMVAVCGKNTVAIECDGDRWYSGESKIREDMERQTILERIGWRFIRIRGSEYYRDAEKTIARVILELSKFGIEPEETGVINADERETKLLQRVKNRAAAIMNDDNFSDEIIDDTIEFALNPKSTFSNSKTPNIKSTVISDRQKSDFESKKVNVRAESTMKISQPKINQTQYSVSPPKLQPMESTSKIIESPQNPKANDILAFLKKHNVNYIDNRLKGGSLWIIDNGKINSVILEAGKLGYNFKFQKGGGKATKGKDAWYCKK